MARYAVKRKMVHIGKRQRGKKAMGENAFGGIGARANGDILYWYTLFAVITGGA